ncbi:beta-1,4-galactosyltransferase 4-like [Physella acuta]|uniref:beta-1,4-galactosyltransferase 4-like n=1 Tax=Physella acuta TaxID=109671 RepID=UPI0027DD8C7D|nr:beta-1,4-galactosyltransferase 4-like [Physella acuta]
MYPKFLLKRKLGQVLVVIGLSTTLVCVWLSQLEWDATNEDLFRKRPRRNVNPNLNQDFVIVNTLLKEIRGNNEDTEAEELNKGDNLGDAEEFQPKEYDAGSEIKSEFEKEIDDIAKPCPLYPTDDLIGRLAGLKQCVAPEELPILYPEVEKGGRIRPKNCVAQERVAIIIPFRNRFVHLYILLNNLIPMMQRQKIDATFFVIEQAPPTLFNRAALFNVGFLEASKLGNFDCFIFHDVDLIPLNDRNLYRCDEHPIHFAVAMDKYEYKLPYKKYFGGVVGFTKEQYLRINGNSNLYFGWGGEDDDLFERIDNKQFEIARPYLDVGKYDMIRHVHDKGNEDNCDRRRLLRTARKRQDVEGLNTVKYKVNYLQLKSHMTWLNIHFDMQAIIDTAPEETRQDMEMSLKDSKSSFCNFSRDAPIRE